jgi:hypothetical protein
MSNWSMKFRSSASLGPRWAMKQTSFGRSSEFNRGQIWDDVVGNIYRRLSLSMANPSGSVWSYYMCSIDSWLDILINNTKTSEQVKDGWREISYSDDGNSDYLRRIWNRFGIDQGDSEKCEKNWRQHSEPLQEDRRIFGSEVEQLKEPVFVRIRKTRGVPSIQVRYMKKYILIIPKNRLIGIKRSSRGKRLYNIIINVLPRRIYWNLL